MVAADGLWSGLRGATGDSRNPRPSGFNAYRTMLPRAAAPPGLAEAGGLWLGPGRHVVNYAVSAGAQVNVVVVAPGPERREGWSAEASADEVRSALAQAAPPLRELAETGAAWSAWTLRDLGALRMSWGRLALLGDAAHPVLPYLAQGGALAIEDAAVLAACLDGAAEVPAALQAYEAQRLPRVRRVQEAARRNALVYHAGWPVSAIRDRILRRLGPDGMSGRYAWLYGWRPPG